MEFTLPGLSHREAKHLSVSHPAGSRARGHPPKRPKRSLGTCPLLQPWHSRATPSPEVFCQHRAPGKGAVRNKALPRAPFPKERPWSSTWNISRGEQPLIFAEAPGKFVHRPPPALSARRSRAGSPAHSGPAGHHQLLILQIWHSRQRRLTQELLGVPGER